jgi:hypothetical protein
MMSVLKRGFTVLSMLLALCVTKTSMDRIFARSDVLGSRTTFGLSHHQPYRRAGNRYTGAASYRDTVLVSSGEITELKLNAFHRVMDRGIRPAFTSSRTTLSLADASWIIPPSGSSSRPLRC